MAQRQSHKESASPYSLLGLIAGLPSMSPSPAAMSPIMELQRSTACCDLGADPLHTRSDQVANKLNPNPELTQAPAVHRKNQSLNATPRFSTGKTQIWYLGFSLYWTAIP